MFIKIRKTSTTKTIGAQAAMAAKATNLGPKEFLEWLHQQDKEGNLPKGLLDTKQAKFFKGTT
jgi:hypothetical protein